MVHRDIGEESAAGIELGGHFLETRFARAGEGRGGLAWLAGTERARKPYRARRIQRWVCLPSCNLPMVTAQ